MEKYIVLLIVFVIFVFLISSIIWIDSGCSLSDCSPYFKYKDVKKDSNVILTFNQFMEAYELNPEAYELYSNHPHRKKTDYYIGFKTYKDYKKYKKFAREKPLYDTAVKFTELLEKDLQKRSQEK